MTETSQMHPSSNESERHPADSDVQSGKARRSRAHWGGRVVTVAMLVGGASAAFALQTPDGLGLPIISSVSQELHRTTTSSTAAPTTPPLDAETIAFTTAKVGDCLAWSLDANQAVEDFKVVGCDAAHNYEVSGKIELTDYETTPGEFGTRAPYPAAEQLGHLADSLCQDSLTTHLDGKLDPNGKIHAAPILPSRSQWKAGDRTVLCGGMSTNAFGDYEQFTGRLSELDQSRVFEPRLCATTDEYGSLIAVDCNEDHTLESTAIINLPDYFGPVAPTDQQQNDLLAEQCVLAAQNYLGGDDALYNSTLVPFWTGVTAEAYDMGSRQVNCWLMKDNGYGSFSTLRGFANENFTIDGAPPVPQPPRNPLRSEVGLPEAGATN